MDKQQAQFILQSFRPNGADSADADFQEALQLVVADRELGEWFTAERAADAEFADALAGVNIPVCLRLSLLAIMRGEAAEDIQLDEGVDQVISGALADVQPPEGLRDQVIAAMEVEKHHRNQVQPLRGVARNVQKKKWINIAAIAAALVLGVFFALQIDLSDKDQLTSYDVQQSAANILNTQFSLDVKHEDSTHLTSWLADHHLPAPRDVEHLPPGLRKLPSIGCKRMELPGEKEASLICFIAQGGGALHLIVVSNQWVSDMDLPSIEEVTLSNCYHCPKTSWNVVRWRDATNSYILMSKHQADRKQELLGYF